MNDQESILERFRQALEADPDLDLPDVQHRQGLASQLGLLVDELEASGERDALKRADDLSVFVKGLIPPPPEMPRSAKEFEFRRRLAENLDDVQAWILLGLEISANPLRAIESREVLNVAATMASSDPEIQLNLAHRFFRQGRMKEAARTAKKVIEKIEVGHEKYEKAIKILFGVNLVEEGNPEPLQAQPC